MACIYCKNGNSKRVYPDIPNTRRCNICGSIYSYDDTGVTDLVYGSSWRERCAVRYAITDRYLMLHVNRGAEKPRGGLLGIFVAAAVQMARDDETRYGYYALSELRHVVYPFRANKIKGDVGIRFVFRDGSDFILKRGYGHWTGVCAFLKEAGVEIVDGSDRHFGDRYCQKPFINEDTADLRVCAPAAEEIQMMEGNLAVPLIGGAEAEQMPVKSAPMLQTIYDLSLPVAALENIKEKGLILLKDLLAKSVPELRAMGVKEATLLQLSTAREKFGLIQGEGFAQLQKPPHIPEEEAPAEPIVPEPTAAKPAPQPTAVPPVREAPQPTVAAPVTEHAPESAAPEATDEAAQLRRDRRYKFCTCCGEKLEREDAFCPECGTKQRR